MVLQSLGEAKEMLSAKELAFRMKLLNPVSAPGLTTVYRSLELLTRMGLTQEVRLDSEEKRYEVVHPGEHHHHLVCKICGQNTKLPQCLLGSALENQIEEEFGFTVSSHVLEIFGSCKRCTRDTEGEVSPKIKQKMHVH